MAKNNYLCEAKDHPFMITLDTIRKPVEADLQAFDEFVARQFTAEGDLLDEMLRYALSSRGKGIRPTLVMLSAAMNAPQETERLGLRVSLAAMLVEMIHVASLIHDDVIDESWNDGAGPRSMPAGSRTRRCCWATSSWPGT